MDAINLTIGNKLELELYDSEDRKKPHLISQFEALLPDGNMEILAPIYEGRIYPVLHGMRMRVIFERNGELFCFDAVNVGRKLSGRVLILIIQPQSDVMHLQRRSFFRFNCLLDVQYRAFENPQVKNEDRGEFKSSITRDISGGGLCLLTNEKLERGWFVEGKFNAGGEIKFIGRIVRVTSLHDKGKFKYETGIEFETITNMDRERVISFIFDSQRKLLKKGWLTK